LPTRESSSRQGYERLRAASGRVTVAGVLCMLALTGVPTHAMSQVRLPTIGDVAAEDLPVGVERRYGDEIMREVWRDPAYLDDPVLNEYLQALWQPMLEAARRRGDIEEDLWAQLAWKTFLVQDRSVNAFALPGGFVGVHLGLIAITTTRDELASVLAHEMSHVSQRHIARSLASANRQGTASLAAMLLGILVAARSGNADVAQAAVVGSQAAAIQGQLNFSRDMEREADRIGYGIFSAAGFRQTGMVAMFEKLDQAGRLNDSGAYPYLRTHPLTVERVSEARSRLVTTESGPWAADVWHSLMRARARVLMDPGEAALRRHIEAAGETGEGESSVGLLYAAALAAVRLRDPGRAARFLERLQGSVIARSPDFERASMAVRLLKAEAAIAGGIPEKVADIPWPRAMAESRPALVMRATAMLQVASSSMSQRRQVDEALRAWLTVHRDDAVIWNLQGQLADTLGNRLQALRAQAEARAAQGDLPAAIDRLRLAQSASRSATGADLVDASIIDARLRELEERQRANARPGQRAGGTPAS
jgi:beta-barrel assembly-enhancing protease